MNTVTLEAGQPLNTDPDWIVIEGGDYAPNALVDCRRASDPSQVVAYYALFILTGEYPQ